MADGSAVRPPLQILVTDGDAIELVSGLVAEAGIRAELHHAATAQACIAALGERSADCLIVDHSLPDMSGIDLVARLRRDFGDLCPPIIMLTRSGNERLAVAALKNGVSDYLVKGETTATDLSDSILGAIKTRARTIRQREESLALERQAYTDNLTGLWNRHYFEMELQRALDLGSQIGAATALLVIDLNGFKLVNDRYGHAIGDKVLTEIGRRLRETLRLGDTGVRLGGDEFAVIMTSDVNVLSASRLADRLAAELAEPISLNGNQVAVGASIGVALSPDDGTQIRELLHVADRRMYDNKLRDRKVPRPKDEPQRLRDLYGYRVLDTPPEERFDRIARLASTSLDMPIALVSLVDARRQWFKARIGLDVKETPREDAFCAHAICDDELTVVEDALDDERFKSNPLVVDGAKIRFYAGAPLRSPNGHSLGTLCVIDRKPRKLTDHQKQVLTDLADLVINELEVRKARLQAGS